jgi:putative transposase
VTLPARPWRCASDYRWRSKYGGMDVTLMTRMKELEEENRRLKKL